MTPTLILRDESIRQRAIDRIKALKLDVDEPWGVWIAPAPKLRTLDQNAAYWAVVGRIVSATGRSKKVIHRYLKEVAFGKEVEEFMGRLVESEISSRKVERGDFSELIDHANELAAEMGIE